MFAFDLHYNRELSKSEIMNDAEVYKCVLVKVMHQYCRDCRGRDRMVVGTTYVISAYHNWHFVSSNPAQMRCIIYNIM
jgi:hypothetical protein